MIIFNNLRKTNSMKKYILSIICLIFVFQAFFVSKITTFAENNTNIYQIYDENGEFLMDRNEVSVGDIFLTDDFVEWQIYLIVDDIAFARKKESIEKPLINIKKSIVKPQSHKNICLYMTHNDESYKLSDGYDSIYGKGGIHDVAELLKKNLEEKNIYVELDETLHIPHDSSAYSRSKVTAIKLQNNNNPEGLFDIHRDGASRKLYLSQNDKEPLSKVRIVVGKGNSNFEENYAFAQEIFSIGQALYPWLFLDIYCGKGTYNQNIQSHALIFEMGSNEIEKEYVFNAVPYLANVINAALYNSQSDENQITIDEDYVDILEEEYNKDTNQNNAKNGILIFLIISGIVVLAVFTIVLIKKYQKRE